MPSRVRRLYDLEIDEVSLVDRPANQHGVVAIAKRAEDHVATYIDANGDEVDEQDIEFGETVIDPETGQAFYMASPEELDELGYDDSDDGDDGYDFEDEYDDEDELVGVGKRRIPKANMISGGGEMVRSARFSAGSGGTSVRGSMGPSRATRARAGARNAASSARANFNEYRNAGGARERAGRAARNAPGRVGRNAGRISRDPNVRRGAGVGAGVAGAGGAGYAYGHRDVNKSLGQSVLEELSKALDNGDRDEVISKMGDMIETANRSAQAAWRVAKSLQEQQELRDYSALANTYELPVDPDELGGILATVSKSLDDRQLAVLDQMLQASSVGFEELGYTGEAGGDIMASVYAMADEAVGKSSDGITAAQAVTALFETNPDAYDEYCQQNA